MTLRSTGRTTGRPAEGSQRGSGRVAGPASPGPTTGAGRRRGGARRAGPQGWLHLCARGGRFTNRRRSSGSRTFPPRDRPPKTNLRIPGQPEDEHAVVRSCATRQRRSPASNRSGRRTASERERFSRAAEDAGGRSSCIGKSAYTASTVRRRNAPMTVQPSVGSIEVANGAKYVRWCSRRRAGAAPTVAGRRPASITSGP